MSATPIFHRFLILNCRGILKKINKTNVISRTISTSFSLNKSVSFKLSDIGEGIREVVVKEWFVKVGDKVSQFDNICEVQSDKASVTITSRYDGVITKLYYQIDDTALVGHPLIELETDDNNVKKEESLPSHKPSTLIESEDQPNEQIPKLTASPDISNSNSLEDILCIPSVRRLAKEHSIDISKVRGSGKNGRILKEDVLAYMEKPGSEDQDTPSLGTIKYNQEDKIIEPIKGFTKAMVKTMTDALKIPHFVYSDEIKVTKLSKLRKELKNLPELKETKITFLPFFIKAASNALQRYPIINSSLDEKCENIIYHKHHNIGVAMDTNQGLAVPVIKNVESLTVLEVAKELNRIIVSGKNGTFSPNDLTGATFTISNIGVVGGTYTKPVILPPQVAIIAMGMTQILPRFDNSGNIVAEEIIIISGSADHRLLDGITMANFTKTLKKQIEDPNLLFLNL